MRRGRRKAPSSAFSPQLRLELSPRRDALPEDDAEPGPSPEPQLECRHDPRSVRLGKWTLDTEEDQQVGVGATVEPGAVPTRYSPTPVWGPPTLPEWVQAESRDQIGPALDSVATGPYASDEARAHVDPRGNAEAQPCLKARGVGDYGIEPSFHLEGLLSRLRDRGAGRGQCEAKRKANQEASGLHRSPSGGNRAGASPPERDRVVDY